MIMTHDSVGTVSSPGAYGGWWQLVSCNRSSQHKSAPKERHNVAHGVKPWVGAPSLSPFPSPARAGEGCRRRGEGLRTQGSRPGLRYSAASRLSNRTPGSLGFMNELRLQDTRLISSPGLPTDVPVGGWIPRTSRQLLVRLKTRNLR